MTRYEVKNRKRAGQEGSNRLQRNTESRARLTEENPNPVLRISGEGVVVYGNKASLPLLNEWQCQRGERVPGRWFQLTLDALSSAEPKQAEVECGDQILSLTFAPVGDSNYVNVYALDIAESKRTEDMMQKLAAAVMNSNDAVTALGLDGKIIAWNKGAERMYGYSEEEALGMTVADIVPERQKEEMIDLVERSKGGERVESIETKRLTKDGRILDVWLTAAEIKDGNGNTIAVAAIERDITERNRAEEERKRLMAELETKNKELQGFTSVVRHDIGNSLLSIQAFSVVLSRYCEKLGELLEGEDICEHLRERARPLLKNDIPEAIEYIQTGANRISNLLKGLKRLALIGHIELNIERLDLNKTIKQITGAMKFQIQNSDASVVTAHLPRCLGDAAQISQVFQNLLTNAINYLDPSRKGSIQISGRVENGMAIYSIEDNGIGIAPENHEKVFEVFHRIDPSGAVTGDGLGLSIVSRILDRHQGKIWLESDLNKGTIFYVSLPSA